MIGTLLGSATAHSRDLLALDQAVRRPLPRCRRIGFVSCEPGSGGTAAAVAVTAQLARRRAGRVLGVTATTLEAWSLEVAPVAHAYDVVVTDWGVRSRGAELALVAERSHVLCVVARATLGSVVAAGHLLARLAALPQPPRVVVAWTGPERPAAEWPVPVVRLDQCRHAHLRLAAELVRP